VARLATTPLSPALYGGLSGVGWTLAHLAGWIHEPDEDDPNAVIDEVLSDLVRQTPWSGEYDLIGGLVGIGVYALERLASPAGAALLAAVIDRLAELAQCIPAGITWFTSPERLPEQQRQLFPQGYYNLGLAHGVPGVIALLGRTVAAGVTTAQARPLLDGAVRWLLAQELETETEAGFPAWVETRPETEFFKENSVSPPAKPARLAWCYGELGIAAALLSVAQRVDQPAWAAAALRIARRAARRSYAASGVRDGCLCHGAAGVGHLFNRLYQATGDPRLADAAHWWIHEALAIRQPEQGIAGYCFWRSDQGWDDTPGFLEGAAGIGLALLAAATPVEPKWDRLLLVDLPLA
jgi:hypothetical protein